MRIPPRRRALAAVGLAGVVAVAAAVAVGTSSALGADVRTPRAAAGSGAAAASKPRPADPPTYAGEVGGRIALFRTSDGRFLKYLTTKGIGARFSPDRAFLYYEKGFCGGMYRITLSRGRTSLVRTGPQGGSGPYAVGPGPALAGNTCGIAGKLTRITDYRGKDFYVGGIRGLGATQLSFTPRGNALALSDYPGEEVRIVLLKKNPQFRILVPCPKNLSGCSRQAGEYAPDGTLYFVASKGSGSRRVSYLAAYNGKVSRTVSRLPAASPVMSMSAARSGALLIAGCRYDSTKRSDFVLVWNRGSIRRLPTNVVQPAW